MADIVFINPNNRIISPFAGVEPPLWLGVMASYYRDVGKAVAVIDAEAMDYSVNETAQIAMDLSPSKVIIVVMGNNPSVSSTPKMIVTKRLVDNLIGEIPLAVAGLHPSALPRQTRDELGVEVIKGKGFEGFRPVAWDLLPMYQYRAHNWHCLDGSSRDHYASVYTSLGCPFSCSFCNIHALYGGKHQIWHRNPDDVIDEVGLLVEEYDVKNLKIWDELFALNEKHVNAICDRLIDRDYKLNIWAYARVDTITYTMLEKMKKAGINWLGYGFESGDTGVLKGIDKKTDKDEAIRAVHMTHDVGININGNFLFGLPGDKPETMLRTFDFARELELEYANFYVALPYPGSRLYNKMNYGSWIYYDQFSAKSSHEGVQGFRDRAFIDFFSDPQYRVRIRHKFGEQAVEQIRGMLEFGKPVTRGSYEAVEAEKKENS